MADLDGWVMPYPSLDEDDRFQIAIIGADTLALVLGSEQPQGTTIYIAVLGPSGYGCFYCGGPYDGLIAVPARSQKGRLARIASCLEHKSFGMGWMDAKLASV